MTADKNTLCHGEGNLGRTCALRNSCLRYLDLETQILPIPQRTQSRMLCRPTILLTGDGGVQKNAYRYYVPVGQGTDTVG